MQSQREKPIGVLDSGLGGLTVVRQLEQLLPEENIIYFGDNANCPYGNRSKEDIFALTRAMLNFMKAEGVKIVAIACNTISALADELRKHYEFPIISIIEEACKYTANEKLKQAGVFATEFTIKNGAYSTLLGRLNPETQVYGVSSRTLAALVDDARFYDPATDAEVLSMINTLMKTNPLVKHVILGCTHYPIVQDIFEKAAPEITFINPAAVQAEAVKTLLTGQDLLNNCSKPYLRINTSGDKQLYEKAIKKLEIATPFTVAEIR